MINIISNVPEGNTSTSWFTSFNHIAAHGIKMGFESLGVDARFVSDQVAQTKVIPAADDTLVISSFAMCGIRDAPVYRENVKAGTKRNLCLYLDSVMNGMDEHYDHVFTLIRPWSHASDKFVYGGYGADPELFYPEQEDKSVFVDSRVPWDKPGLQDSYAMLDKVLVNTGINVICPTKTYNKGRLPWAEIQKMLRKSSFFCCTQPGEGGIIRVEAAMCGALLVVPDCFPRLGSIECVENVRWSTPEELIDIFNSELDHHAIREKARAHSWGKVAERIVRRLDG